jgi:hypothetical protein
MVWWGIYIGSFEGSLGALMGVLMEGSGTAPSRLSDGETKPPGDEDDRAFLTADNAIVEGAPLTAEAVSQLVGGSLGGVEAR